MGGSGVGSFCSAAAAVTADSPLASSSLDSSSSLESSELRPILMTEPLMTVARCRGLRFTRVDFCKLISL